MATGPVYSTRFIGSGNTVRRDLAYTVPPGFRAVVRSISFFNSSSGNSDASVLIGGLCYIAYFHQVPASGFVSWSGDQVVNASETISALQAPGNGFFMISGFLLSV